MRSVVRSNQHSITFYFAASAHLLTASLLADFIISEPALSSVRQDIYLNTPHSQANYLNHKRYNQWLNLHQLLLPATHSFAINLLKSRSHHPMIGARYVASTIQRILMMWCKSTPASTCFTVSERPLDVEVAQG